MPVPFIHSHLNTNYMKQKTIILRNFDECSEELKAKILQNYRDINTNFEWWESVYDWKTEQATEKGFEIDRIYFSGFWSQGDGAMFEGRVIDVTKFMDGINPHVKRLLQSGLLSVSCSFKHYGHYYHEKSYQHSFDADCPGQYDNIWLELERVEQNITSAYENYCGEIYAALEKEYEYLTSDEIITETLQANKYLFNEQGKIDL